MLQPQKITTAEGRLSVVPFQWQDWNALWQLRSNQLAEQGIRLAVLPVQPDFDSPYEEGYHRINQMYLRARGNFWLAWADVTSIGHIGAQDIGDYVELRRMYVRKEYRRYGVGTQLVQTLIAHCVMHDVSFIELWTEEQGPGRFLYAKSGFDEVRHAAPKGKIVTDPQGKIRMRLTLNPSAT